MNPIYRMILMLLVTFAAVPAAKEYGGEGAIYVVWTLCFFGIATSPLGGDE